MVRFFDKTPLLCYIKSRALQGGFERSTGLGFSIIKPKEGFMIGWILFLAVLTILSYLAETGIFTFVWEIRVPFLRASLLSVLLLLCTLGILFRMLYMKRKGEKEKLQAKIAQIEQKSSG